MKISALALASLLTFSLPAMAQTHGYDQQDSATDTAIDVSLIQLVATPQAFDGKKVRVVGFFAVLYKENALYFHREDADHAIWRNAIWIDLPPNRSWRDLNRIQYFYVICEGTFSANEHGHTGMFSGGLDQITRLQVWKPKDH